MNDNETVISNESYTNKDFSTIYPELLEVVKNLTSKWDPSISNESDPGVVLLKLNAIIGDKNNYNIDKNMLETFPVSVTQRKNAWSIFDQQGYNMKWYKSAIGNVQITWNGNELDSLPIGTTLSIPRFSMVANDDQTIVYTTTEDALISRKNPTVSIPVIQGIAKKYSINNRTDLTPSDLVDNRIYFDESMIADNGIFINIAGKTDFLDWRKVNVLNVEKSMETVYKFGIDIETELPYIEFSDDIINTLSNGFNITYIQTLGENGNIPYKTLTNWYSEITDEIIINDSKISITLNGENTSITNIYNIIGGQDIQSIDDAYSDYKKQIGTFDTLVTIRDYINKAITDEVVSNGFVCDRTNDIQSSWTIVTNQMDISTRKLMVDKGINSKPELDAFDLKIYAFKNIDVTFTLSKDTFDKSFDLDVKNESIGDLSAPEYITDSFTQNKCLSHDYRDLLDSKFLLFKNIYDVNCRIIPNTTLSVNQREEIKNNITNLLFEKLNSKVIDFGEPIYYDDIYNFILDSDSRIKSIMLDDIKYKTYAVYYNKDLKQFLNVLVSEIPYYGQIVQKGILTAGADNTINLPLLDDLFNTIVFSYDGKDYICKPQESDVGDYYFYDGCGVIDVSYKETEDATLEVSTEKDGISEIDYPRINKTSKILTVKQSKITDNTNYTLKYIYSPKIKSEEFRDQILAKSILAGITPLFEKESDIRYSLDQCVVGYYPQTHYMDTELNLTLDTTDSHGYKLLENQEVQLYSPNYLDNDTTYSSYVKYEYFNNLSNGIDVVTKIPAGADYVLKQGETLVLYWTASGDDAYYTYRKYEKGTIIEPSFELSGTETTYGRNLKNDSGTLRSTSLQSSIENGVNTILSMNQSIAIKNINQVTLKDSKYYLYWLLNDNNNKLFDTTKKVIEIYNSSLSNNVQAYIPQENSLCSNLDVGTYVCTYNNDNKWEYKYGTLNSSTNSLIGQLTTQELSDTFGVAFSKEVNNVGVSLNLIDDCFDKSVGGSITIDKNFMNNTDWTNDGKSIKELGEGMIILYTDFSNTSDERYYLNNQRIWEVEAFINPDGTKNETNTNSLGYINSETGKHYVTSDQEGRVFSGISNVNRPIDAKRVELIIYLGGYISNGDRITFNVVNKTEYTLKPSEYLIYVDRSLSEFNVVEEGTKLSLSVDNFRSMDDWSLDSSDMNIEELLSGNQSGINLDKWHKFNGGNEELTITQQKSINLTEGTYIKINSVEDSINNSEMIYMNSDVSSNTNIIDMSDEPIDGEEIEVALDLISTGLNAPLPIAKAKDGQYVYDITFDRSNGLDDTAAWVYDNNAYNLDVSGLGITISENANSYTFSRIHNNTQELIYFNDTLRPSMEITTHFEVGSQSFNCDIEKSLFITNLVSKITDHKLYASQVTFEYVTDSSDGKNKWKLMVTPTDNGWNKGDTYVDMEVSLDTYGIVLTNIGGQNDGEEFNPKVGDYFKVFLIKWIYKNSKWTQFFANPDNFNIIFDTNKLLPNGKIELKLISQSESNNNIDTIFGNIQGQWQGKVYNSGNTLLETFQVQNQVELPNEYISDSDNYNGYIDSSIYTLYSMFGLNFPNKNTIKANIGDYIVIDLSENYEVLNNQVIYQPSNITYHRVEEFYKEHIQVDFSIFLNKIDNALNTPVVFTWSQTPENSLSDLLTNYYGWQVNGNTVDVEDYGITINYGLPDNNIYYYPRVGDRMVLSVNNVMQTISGIQTTDGQILLSSNPVNLRNYTVSYKDNETDQWEVLPTLLDAQLAWNAIARYNLNISPEYEYSITAGTDENSGCTWSEKVSIYQKDSTDKIEITGYDEQGNLEPKYILSSMYLEHKGQEKIDVSTIDVNGEQTFPIIYVFKKVLPFPDFPDGVIQSSNGYKLTSTDTLEMIYEFANFKFPQGKYIIPITVVTDSVYDVIVDGPIDLLGNAEQIPSLSVGKFYYRYNQNSEDTETITIRFKTLTSGNSDIIVGYPIKYQEFISEDLKSEYEIDDILNIIKKYDPDDVFNYIYEVPSEVVIDNPLTSESFLDTNHIYNGFTICEGDNFTLSVTDRVR